MSGKYIFESTFPVNARNLTANPPFQLTHYRRYRSQVVARYTSNLQNLSTQIAESIHKLSEVLIDDSSMLLTIIPALGSGNLTIKMAPDVAEQYFGKLAAAFIRKLASISVNIDNIEVDEEEGCAMKRQSLLYELNTLNSARIGIRAATNLTISDSENELASVRRT